MRTGSVADRRCARGRRSRSSWACAAKPALGHCRELAGVAAVMIGRPAECGRSRRSPRTARGLAAASLLVRMANRMWSGAVTGESLADIGRNLARRGGIMAAVDPEFASGGERSEERSGLELLQPRRPVGPAHRRAERARRDGQPVLMPQHGNGERGVHRLVAARQSRDGEREFARGVAVAQLASRDDRIPRPPRGSHGAPTSCAIWPMRPAAVGW